MKYLWIGVGNSPENQQHILNNGGKILSAAVSNDALIAGLDALGVEVDTINCPNIGGYPQYPEKKIKGYNWSRTGKSKDVCIGYENLKFINIAAKQKAMVKAARDWANTNKNEDVTVFVYQMAARFIFPAVEVKKIIPSAKIVLIVPDLPQYMDMNMGALKQLMKKVDWKRIVSCMKYIDQYVLYSKHMSDFLHLKDGCWMVMEGSYNPDLLKKQKEATMLISPRSTEEEASKYCFPSKIFEYMVSGNPVISTRIGGIPDEYFEYLIPIDIINATEIADKIKRVSDMTEEELSSYGSRGRSFVLQEKNNQKQKEKVMEFIEKIGGVLLTLNNAIVIFVFVPSMKAAETVYRAVEVA